MQSTYFVHPSNTQPLKSIYLIRLQWKYEQLMHEYKCSPHTLFVRSIHNHWKVFIWYVCNENTNSWCMNINAVHILCSSVQYTTTEKYLFIWYVCNEDTNSWCMNINAVHILCSSVQYTTTEKYLFDTFAMKIRTADAWI